MQSLTSQQKPPINLHTDSTKVSADHSKASPGSMHSSITYGKKIDDSRNISVNNLEPEQEREKPKYPIKIDVEQMKPKKSQSAKPKKPETNNRPATAKPQKTPKEEDTKRESLSSKKRRNSISKGEHTNEDLHTTGSNREVVARPQSAKPQKSSGRPMTSRSSKGVVDNKKGKNLSIDQGRFENSKNSEMSQVYHDELDDFDEQQKNFEQKARMLMTENLKKYEEEVKKHCNYSYPDMQKTLGSFKLQVKAGNFTDSEIIVLLGQNGTGKTTFIRLLAGLLKPGGEQYVPALNVSYKPQKIAPKFEGTVTELLQTKIKTLYTDPQYQTDVIKPLHLDHLKDNEVKNLSGGELQRVAIVLAFGKPADVYLIDEPSAYLDSEQRLIAAKVLKRFILNSRKAGFVVEHDFIMATYLADRVIVYEGEPGKECTANAPQSLVSGMNKFLAMMGITFRRDPTNYRPRINKLESVKDKEQKLSGNHFVLED